MDRIDCWELAHKQAYSCSGVYGEAVHEEVARKGGFRMEHGGVYHYCLENYVYWVYHSEFLPSCTPLLLKHKHIGCTTAGLCSPVHHFY